MKQLTWLSRFFVGVLFIISGLIKANDPLGFSYKLDEYFTVFGFNFLHSYALPIAIFLCAIEIIMGVALLVGYLAKWNAWALLLLILFFTWLTGYSAITNSVTDCGCFGDAIKLTPWQSFIKDLILLVFIAIIFKNKNTIEPISNNHRLARLVVLATTILSFSFCFYTTYYLPIVDFLPFKVGNNLPELMKVPEGAPQDVFDTKMYYQKNGEIKEFGINNYPWDDSTWKWVETKTVLVKEGYKPPIHDFKIMDKEGNEYTDDVLMNPSYSFLVVTKNIAEANKTFMQTVVNFVLEMEKIYGVKSLGLTASPADETELYRHEYNAAFPFYFADATALKSVVRSNPGLVLLKNGTVIMKWPGTKLPTNKEIERLLNNKNG